MEAERVFTNDKGKSSASGQILTSSGGNLTRNIGFADYNQTEINISKSNADLTQNISKIKQEFLPFLKERDGLNRLLTVPSKFDPSKLEEPSNPAFYYKAERFNKFRLRFGQAERNQQALGKMLSYSTNRAGQTNILEMNRTARMQKLMTKGISNSREGKWVQTEADEDQYESRKRSFRGETSEDEGPERQMLTETNSPTHYRTFGGVLPPQNRLTATSTMTKRKGMASQGNLKIKPEPYLNKPLFKQTDDFSIFYKKLDNDKRNIATSSNHVRVKAQDNVLYLNHIAKKYTKLSKQFKKEDLAPTFSSFAMQSSRIEEANYAQMTHPSQEIIGQAEHTGTFSKGKPKISIPANVEGGRSFLKKRFAN